MVKGVVLAESLRIDGRLPLEGFSVAVVRRDVSGSAVGSQPKVWTFLEIEGPDERGDALATALAGVLEAESGWYADHARSVGVPEHQLDWPE